MKSIIEAAEQRLAEARGRKAEAEAAHARVRQVHVENVAQSARASEIARSRKELTDAENAFDDADIALQAAEAALADAQAAEAAAVEAERVAALSAAWTRRNEAGEKINALIAELAQAAAHFDSAGAAILEQTPTAERGARREVLFHQAERFIPALVAAIAPNPGQVSGLVRVVAQYRPSWNDKWHGIFFRNKEAARLDNVEETVQ